jgi:hypothetical protein
MEIKITVGEKIQVTVSEQLSPAELIGILELAKATIIDGAFKKDISEAIEE